MENENFKLYLFNFTFYMFKTVLKQLTLEEQSKKTIIKELDYLKIDMYQPMKKNNCLLSSYKNTEIDKIQADLEKKISNLHKEKISLKIKYKNLKKDKAKILNNIKFALEKNKKANKILLKITHNIIYREWIINHLLSIFLQNETQLVIVNVKRDINLLLEEIREDISNNTNQSLDLTDSVINVISHILMTEILEIESDKRLKDIPVSYSDKKHPHQLN